MKFISNSVFILYKLSFLAPFVRFKLHLEVPQLIFKQKVKFWHNLC